MRFISNLSIIFLLNICLITISNADTGFGVSDVGTISSVTSIENDITNPVEYKLNQNYPNPFNHRTTIEFTIPKSEFITLKIYSICGQEFLTLISDNLTPGNHKFNWDASGFASGVYYYKIETGSFNQIKKLLLIK